MAKKYDHHAIKVLKDFEPVQKNPGMFIGSTELATHLMTEVFDNCQDEALAGYANLIGVVINTKTKEYMVMDNGRGIPIENDTIKTVASTLFSGGKFEKSEGDAYGIASGLHGVGIVAVTALSEWMEIEVYRDKKHALYRWEKSILVKDIVEEFTGEVPFSTCTKFKPASKYFGSTLIDTDYIRKRMKLASVHIPKLKLALNIDGHNELITCDINQYFKEDILKEDVKNITPIKDIVVQVGEEELVIRWCYSLDGSPTPRQHGSINILSVDQGTHIVETSDLFRTVLFDLAKKKKMDINKQDCLVGFRSLTCMLLYQPNFTSQNKEKFDKRKDELAYLYSKAKVILMKQLEEDETTLLSLLLIFDNYRKRLDSTRTIVKSSGTVTRANSFIDCKLRDCITHSVSESELYIVEGESASGTLISARNPDIHAVLPLRGKSIPNVAAGKDPLIKKRKGKDKSSSKEDKKSELVELINACGTGIEPDFNIDGIRYGKIIICPDADADGRHIATIIMVAFLKLMPEIIKRGFLYVADMPLYGIRKKDSFIPVYTEGELEKYKSGKDHIIRFKGLGEMNSDQLGLCLLDTKYRRLIKVEYPDDPDSIFKLMVDSALKRKLV